MNTIDREQLLALFVPSVHPSLENALQQPHIIGLAVYEGEDGRRAATPAQNAQPPILDRQGRRLIGVYLKDRMKHALAYMQEHPGTTAYAAAQVFGVSKQALYHAVRRAKHQAMKSARPVCPCCGQALPKNQ